MPNGKRSSGNVQAVIDEYAKEKMAEAAAEYAGVALQMACALTDRIPADSKVHQLPLQADIARMLKKADTRSDLPQEKVNTIARGIAEDRATFESKIAFARELVAGDQRDQNVCRRARIVFMKIYLSSNSERTVDLAHRTGSIRCA